MSKKISSAEYPLSKIFGSDFEYHIPSYQRPYAWTKEQAEELFDDLYDFYKRDENAEEEYFLGSIVLIKQEGQPCCEVIDGQQRLTTLTILLAAICHNLPDDQHDSMVKIKEYISEPGNEFERLESKHRLFLRERDKDFFAEYVQKLNLGKLLECDPERLNNEAQKNILKNSQHFIEEIENKFKSDFDKLKKFTQFLMTRCSLVIVSTPNQQSAFRIFSVMNSRGLDLQPTDIIKADVIGKIAPEEEQNEYNNRWEEAEDRLGRSGFNDLFSFIRMIHAKEKAKESLQKEFQHQVIDKVRDSKKLIEDILEPYAEVLAIVKESDYTASSNAQEVNKHLRWLNWFDNSDWIPVAIFFMRQQRDNSEYVSWFFKKLERLAAYLHVCGKNVNVRIRRYNKVISSLEDKSSHSLENPISAVNLDEAEIKEMKEILDGDVYRLTSRRKYIILRLDEFISDGAASYNSSKLTIEHVLPQTVTKDSEWEKLWPEKEKRERWVHKIANLVPLNRARNARAQNYDFAKKKSAYFKGTKDVSSYALTTQVLSKNSWKEEDLVERQKMLLKSMCKNWELG